MYTPDAYIVLNRTDPVPHRVVAELPEVFLQNYVRDVGFVGIDDALPQIVAALRTRYAAPQLLVQHVNDDVSIYSLRFASDSGDVWGSVMTADLIEIGSPDDYAALPAAFTAYYRWLDGLQLVAQGQTAAFEWTVLPCRYAGRVELLNLFRTAGVAQAATRKLYTQMRSKSLQMWIQGADGDVFFADEFNKAGTLFHLHLKRPELVSIVRDGFLDAYVAHVLQHRSAQGFALGSWLQAM